jgi:hypothetical protein
MLGLHSQSRRNQTTASRSTSETRRNALDLGNFAVFLSLARGL